MSPQQPVAPQKTTNQTGQLLVLPLFPCCIISWWFFPLIHAAGKVRGHHECGGTVTQLSPGDVFCRSSRRGKEEAMPETFYKHQQGSVKVFPLS